MALWMSGRAQWSRLVGLALCLGACHKNAEPQPNPAASLAPATSATATVDAATARMMGDDPGRCVKQVLVQGDALCFEFNRGYYWCRGYVSPFGPPVTGRPEYHLLPKHYERLYLGDDLACGRNSDGSVECWGIDRDGMLGAKGTRLKTPVVVRDVSGPIEIFSLNVEGYCLLSQGRVILSLIHI